MGTDIFINGVVGLVGEKGHRGQDNTRQHTQTTIPHQAVMSQQQPAQTGHTRLLPATKRHANSKQICRKLENEN